MTPVINPSNLKLTFDLYLLFILQIHLQQKPQNISFV